MKLEISPSELFNMIKEVRGQPEVTPACAIEPAKFQLLFDEKKCCACRICETVCAQYHEGDANPVAARNNVVVRPLNKYAEVSGLTANPPDRPPTISRVTFGEYSEHNFCRQCISPECMFVCPLKAIYIDPETKARVVDEEKCSGCGLCENACPWGMIRVNPETKKAVKCDLCGGNPQCAEWCPTDAITVKEV